MKWRCVQKWKGQDDMELITTNRKETGAGIVPYTPHAPHVAKALQTLGTEYNFFRYYVPANLHYICRHQENAMRMGKTRQVSLILAAYGTMPVVNTLKEHFIWVNMQNLYGWSDREAEVMAVSILRTEEARLLDWISLLGFFRDIVDGRITLYGGNHRDVMQAFQAYYKTAKLRDNELRTKLAREQEQEQHKAEILRGEAVAKIMEKLKNEVENGD